MTAAVVCLNGGKGSGSEQPNKLSPNDDEILEKRHLDWSFPKFVVMISVGVACKLATLHRPLYVLTLQTHLHEEEQRPLELNPRNQKQLLYLFSAGVFCREPDTTFASMASLQLHCHPFAPFHNCAGGGQLLSLETIRATFDVTLGCLSLFVLLFFLHLFYNVRQYPSILRGLLGTASPFSVAHAAVSVALFYVGHCGESPNDVVKLSQLPEPHSSITFSRLSAAPYWSAVTGITLAVSACCYHVIESNFINLSAEVQRRLTWGALLITVTTVFF